MYMGPRIDLYTVLILIYSCTCENRAYVHIKFDYLSKLSVLSGTYSINYAQNYAGIIDWFLLPGASRVLHRNIGKGWN